MATYCEVLALHDEKDTIISVDRDGRAKDSNEPIVLSISDSTDNPHPIYAQIMLTPKMAGRIARALMEAVGHDVDRAW